jgi:hypothetical protein
LITGTHDAGMSRHHETTPTPVSRHPSIELVICRGDAVTARLVEDRFGQLCADQVIEILDGFAIQWFADQPAPAYRPLNTLPRMAILPEARWQAWIAELTGAGAPTPPVELAEGVRLHRGECAVIAFCTGIGGTPDAVGSRLGVSPTSVTTSAVTPTAYSRLRHRH